jgi:hypothetical protein
MKETQSPEVPAGIPAPTINRRVPRYFALHEAGLRNGSFFRVWERVRFNRVAQYVNGDHMGSVDGPKPGRLGPFYEGYFGIGAPVILDGLPRNYFEGGVVEFDRKTAERLIPVAAGGKGRRY